MQEMFLCVLLATGWVAVVFFLVCLDDFLIRGRLRPIEEKLGFRHPHSSRKDRVSHILQGQWKTTAVEIYYHSSTRSRRASISFSIRVPTRLPSTVSFHREKPIERMAKSIGLTKEAQANDPLFDREVFVEAENDGLAPPLLANASLRWKIADLLNIPRASVNLGPTGVDLMIQSHWGWKQYWDVMKVEELLGKLLAIFRDVQSISEESVLPDASEALFSAEGSTFSERMNMLREPGRGAVFISALLFFVGPLTAIWGGRYPPVTWRLTWMGLGLSAFALFIYTPILFKLVRGGSQSHRRFSFFMFAALVGFPTFGVGSLHVINGFFDFNPPFQVEGHVISMYYPPRRHDRPRLWVEMELSGKREQVSVPMQSYHGQSILRGQSCPVVLSPGALGEAWIVKANALH